MTISMLVSIFGTTMKIGTYEEEVEEMRFNNTVKAMSCTFDVCINPWGKVGTFFRKLVLM